VKIYALLLLIVMAAVKGFSAGNDSVTQKNKQDTIVWPNKIPGRDAGLAQLDQGWRVRDTTQIKKKNCKQLKQKK
jgi:hypothetical protein